MDPSTEVPCKGSAFFKDTHRHHGFLGHVIFISPESDPAKDADNNWSEDIARVPREQDASSRKTKEERCGAADKDDDTDVINSLEFFANR